MTEIDVYLKGGAVVSLEVNDFSISLTSSGDPYKVTWKNGKSKPMYIAPSEIAAVVER